MMQMNPNLNPTMKDEEKKPIHRAVNDSYLKEAFRGDMVCLSYTYNGVNPNKWVPNSPIAPGLTRLPDIPLILFL